MSKTPVLSEKAPKPIGPYSQAIKANGFLFASGQIALGADGTITGDVVEQAKKVMENVKAVLEAGGTNFDSIVKTTIFLKSMNDFPKVNEVYAGYFTGTPPARSTVEVARLPKDALVEVEVIALAK